MIPWILAVLAVLGLVAVIVQAVVDQRLLWRLESMHAEERNRWEDERRRLTAAALQPVNPTGASRVQKAEREAPAPRPRPFDL